MNVSKKISKSDNILKPEKDTITGVLKQKTFDELLEAYVNVLDRQAVQSQLKKLGITQEDINNMSEKEKGELLQKIGVIILKGTPTENLKKAMIPQKGKIVETRGEIKRMKTERPPPLPKTLPEMEEQKQPPPLPKSSPFETDIVRAELQKRIRRDQREDELEGKYDTDEDEDLGLMEVADLPAIGLPIDYDPPVPDSNLNDNFIRAVNSRSAFQQNPMAPVRPQFRDFSVREDIEEQNRNMRNDPDPLVNPPQPILEQVEILERNPEEMPHAQPHRYENPAVMNNPRLADSNYSSMAQNVMYDELTRGRRQLRRELLGDEEGKYDDVFHELEDDDDDDEIDPNRDVYDDRSLLPDDLSDRERVEQMKELLTYSNAGTYTGNYGVGRDFLRAAMVNNTYIRPDVNTADRLRKEGNLSYREPDRTYSNNAVNLVRQSNRSMAINVSQLLP